MTPVVFHIVTPKGEPIPAAKIKIELTRAGYNEDDSVSIMPRPITVVTDAQGTVTVPLVPCTRLYVMTVEDVEGCAYMQFRFFVPELVSGQLSVQFEDIIVDSPVSQKNWDEAALLVIQETKQSVLDALAETETNLSETVVAKTAAQTAATDAQRDADDAHASLIAAQNTLQTAIGQTNGDFDAISKRIKNVAAPVNVGDAVNLSTVDTKVNTVLTTLDTKVAEVLNTTDTKVATVKAIADAAYPKTGGTVNGSVTAQGITYAGPAASQPRVTLTGISGEPGLILSRWTGQGNQDHVWILKNDAGTFRFQYSNSDRNAQIFSEILAMGTNNILASKNLLLSADTQTFPECQTALIAWDGNLPAANQNKEVARFRVWGVSGVSYNGAFRLYTSSGSVINYTGHALSTYAYDSTNGHSASPIHVLRGNGDMSIKGLLATGSPVNQGAMNRLYSPVVENVAILNVGRSDQGVPCVAVHGSNAAGQWGSFAAVMYIGKNSTTNRSSANAGTVNTSGNDYAEYFLKSDTCNTVAAGQVIGINNQNQITDVWSEAVMFAIKTTDPSFVGGDTWSQSIGPRPNPKAGEAPVMPVRMLPEYDDAGTQVSDGDSDELWDTKLSGFESAYQQWQANVAIDETEQIVFNEKLEVLRKRVDRVSIAGRTPVNILGATPGDYIIPVQNGTEISSVAVAEADMTLLQYMRAVGQVINILADGRAYVMVKSV